MNETLAIVLPIIGTVLAVGVAIAGLLIRTTARIDADGRAWRASVDADRRAWQATMDTYRAEMQARAEKHDADRRQHDADMRQLAERQSRVEGRFDERGAVAD